jgi:cell wall-associated NlpC family hydrolase
MLCIVWTPEALIIRRMLIMLVKLKAKIVVLIITITFLVSVSTVNADSVLSAVVCCDSLNLRDLPDINSNVVATLSQNSCVNVIKESSGWSQVSFSKSVGWVKSNYLVLKGSTKSDTSSDGDTSNLRLQPELTSMIIDEVYKENKSDTVASNGLNKVKSLEGLFGYVYNGLLALKDGLASRGGSTEATGTPQTKDPKATLTPKSSAPVKAEPRTGYIKGSIVFIRKDNSLNASPISKLYLGDKIQVYDNSGDWYNIKTGDGTTGWVFNEYIDFDYVAKPIPTVNVPAGTAAPKIPTPAPTRASTGNKGQQIANYVRQFLGYKYVYGGESPSGFDCSGLVLYVYSHFGVDLNRVAADQAKQGQYVAKSSLIPGDVVFFSAGKGSTYISHVGIYIGDGDMIHASNPQTGVKQSDINSGGYPARYVTARRIVFD